jgi:hypothetical protein
MGFQKNMSEHGTIFFSRLETKGARARGKKGETPSCLFSTGLVPFDEKNRTSLSPAADFF